MKKTHYYLLLAILCQFISFGQVLDQSNLTTSSVGNFTIQQPTNQGKVGQSFVADVSGPLAQLKVEINVPFAATTVDLSIYSGAGDSGALLGTLPLTFSNSFIGEYTINTSSLNINMVQGSSYTIVFKNATPNTFSWMYTSGNLYANGDSFLSTNASPFSVITGVDMVFKTFVIPATPPTLATHLNFDGVNDYVSLPNESAFDFSNVFTVEFWLKTTTLPSFQSDIISKGNTWGVHLTNDGKVYVNASFMSAISTTNVADGNWHHIAAKFANSTIEIFVDGLSEQQRFNAGVTIDNNDFNVAIGSNLEQANRLFNGNIDDLRIWSVARTSGQISGSRSCELQGNEPGLLAYYKFNHGFSGYNNAETLVLNDDSTNSNNGVFNNMALNGSISNFLDGSIVTSGSTIPAAPIAQPQAACIATFADLIPPPSSTTKWYPTLDTTYFYPPTAQVFTSTYYFTTINANGCESERTPINITVLQAPMTDYQIGFPIGFTATPLTATSGGTGLLWYTSETGGLGSTTAPTPDTSTLGSTVYWVASTDANGCESTRTSLEVFITPLPPSNDDCSGTIPLTVGNSVTSNAVTVDLGGATDSSTAPSPNCSGYEGGDVWYSAIVPTSGNLTIETFGVNNWDTVLEVYSGDCTNLNYMDCNDNDNQNDEFSRVTLTNLTPGENVYIRVWEYNNAFTTSSFQISAYFIAPPVNDECATSTALTVGTSSISNAVAVNLAGATDSTSAPYPDCGSYDGGDVWYTAVVPASGNLTVETFGATNWDTLLEIYNGSCTSLNYLRCNDNDNNEDFSKVVLTGLTPNETIYIRVWEYDTENSIANFQISVYDNQPPVNDECLNAVELTVGSSITSNSIDVNLNGATDSIDTASAPFPNCSSYEDGDVWYKVIAPVTGEITITTSSLIDQVNTGLEIYTGSCGNLITEACNDDISGSNYFSSVSVSGLTIGETLYIRTWEVQNNVFRFVPTSKTFKISAYSPDILSNASFVDANFTIYPNPTTSNVNIKLGKLTNAKLEVVDINGRILLQNTLNYTLNHVNTSNLPTGMYFFKITSDEGTFTRKIVKN